MSNFHHSRSSLLHLLLGEIRLVFVRSYLVVCQPSHRTFQHIVTALLRRKSMCFCPLPWMLASKRWIFLAVGETHLAQLFWGLWLKIEDCCLCLPSTTTSLFSERQEIKAVLCCLWPVFSVICPDSLFPWESPSHLDSAFERKLRYCTCILIIYGCLAVCKPECAHYYSIWAHSVVCAYRQSILKSSSYCKITNIL